jgi:hypothetical protein
MGIDVLVGKTLNNIIRKRDGSGSDELIFVTIYGEQYRMYHDQDCCESVYIEDICGDLDDLLHSPILIAEEVIKGRIDLSVAERIDAITRDYDISRTELAALRLSGEFDINNYDENSETWTFYKIDTAKGGVTIRWYGTSNGYYSEGVSFGLERDCEDY